MKVNKIYIGCAIAVTLLLLATCGTYLYLNISKGNIFNNNKTKYKESDLNVVASLEDEVSENSVWCGTFNIVWNELKEKVAKGNIILDIPSTMSDNLNKSTFNISYLSEDSYYKTHGYQTYELRDQIKKDIKDKFNEESDILDDFEWQEKTTDIFLYTMLKKDFKFEKPFDKLENSTFKNYSNVKFFGINENSKDELRNQVSVLYYKDYNEFAIKLATKGIDEVILIKNPNGNSFLDIYNNIISNNKTYKGSKSLESNEHLSIPNIDFKTKVNFKQIENKKFKTSEGDIYTIAKTLQTINFSLDNKGGKLKSEAAILTKETSSVVEDIRYFNINDTFAIFLKEKDKDLPYFASLISDISQVQDKVKAN